VHGVDLWVVIDDGAQQNLSLQFPDLRRFILSQPANTEVGVGYIRNGSIVATQPLTADHEHAAASLRIPVGPAGISASPYTALAELIHHWPASPRTREILMITNGFDPEYGPGPDDPYLDEAIHAAQRAGTIVYSIYYSGMGRFGHAGFESYWGQYNLAQISDATGGELYWQGNWNPVSIAPYLDDLGHRLNEQYLVTFLASAESKPGLRDFKISAEVPHVHLTSPSRAFVPAAR
jgi:hypothetical protein